MAGDPRPDARGTRVPGEIRRSEGRSVATTNDLKNGLVLNLDGSSGPSSSSSTSSPARAAPSCAPSSRTCSPARSSTRPSTPASRSRRPPSTSATCSSSYKDGDRLRLHGHGDLRPDPRRRKSVGDAANFLLESHDATVAHARGRALYVELPASVELVDQVHRAGPAGRPLHRRHQARHRWRPATRSRSRSSSPPARRSRSTPATGDYLGRVNS